MGLVDGARRARDRARRGRPDLGRAGPQLRRRAAPRSGTATSAADGSEIAEAAAAQIRKIPSYSGYGDLATRPAVDLAERLAALAPLDDARVFFTSGGAEAIESAAKLSRRYFSLIGQPERTRADLARQGLPRPGRVRDEPRGGGRLPRGADVARPRRRPRPMGLRRRAPRGDRSRSGRARRGLLRRAGDRRGRRVRAAGGLLRRGARDHARCGLPARRRRGDHELRPLRALVRERALADRPGPDRVRQGLDVRLPASGRRDRRRPRRGAVLASRRRGDVPARLHVLRPRDVDRGLARQPRHPRPRGPDRARNGAGGEITEALEPLAAHPLVAEIRSGPGRHGRRPAHGSGARRQGCAPRPRATACSTRVLSIGALQVSPPS